MTRHRRSTFATIVLTIGLAAAGLGAGTASADTSSAEPTGVTVAVHPNGSYLISTAAPLPTWSFGGTVGHPLTGVTVNSVPVSAGHNGSAMITLTSR